ncbi:sigma-70 family RNA polymerase sigma factor [Tautonia rosea]|uniref:sigma-70 family RNA polymerase sigma factor n=1 Tax=Tautonia rosea TaxID=2728037 RepID=UPI0014761B88|nr:sigma-70 family RNA polymerase sigma factor [Tautonia rosea]
MAIERHAGILQSFRTLFGPGTLAGRSDEELLDRASRRDDPAAEQAFAALIERHGPMVQRVCRSRLIDPNDADDAFQRVFCLLAQRSRTLWVRDSLAPWLFQVALRVSAGVRAEASRRRDVERRYAEHAPRIAPAREPDDLAPLLLDEVGRLPERYRSAIVLCDLQGLTHEEAARRLGWPIGTVKSRQARARDRLRRRLIGRGLAPTALVAITSRSAPAAIPRALAERTVPLALQSAASSMGVATGAVSLVTGALTMLTSHPIATLAGGLLLTGAAVVGAVGLARQDDQAPQQTIPVAGTVTEGPQRFKGIPRKSPEPATDRPEPIDTVSPNPATIPVTVSGRTMGLDGRPIAGASVLVAGLDPTTGWAELGRAVTDVDGSYRVERAKVPVVSGVNRPNQGPHEGPYAEVRAVATGPDFGTSWSRSVRIDVKGGKEGESIVADLVLRSSAPIRGTIVDEQGEPRKGVEVSVRVLELLEPAEIEEKAIAYSDLIELLPTDLHRATTGPDGRFRIDGLPAKALLRLTLLLPGFERAEGWFMALTLPDAEDDVDSRLDLGTPTMSEVLIGDFVLTVPEPTPVRVRVVEEVSGEPVSGVLVYSLKEMQPGHPISSSGTSDEEGFLTLGLPAGQEFDLIAEPPVDSIFPQPVSGAAVPEARRIVVPADQNDDVVEIRLRIGCELIIETTDAETGEPLAEALYWLVPEDDPDEPRPIGHSPFTPGFNRLEQSGDRLRVVLRSEPGRTFRARFAGFPGQRPPAFSPEARELPPRFEVDPPESEPFELIGGETIRLRFTIRPVAE